MRFSARDHLLSTKRELLSITNLIYDVINSFLLSIRNSFPKSTLGDYIYIRRRQIVPIPLFPSFPHFPLHSVFQDFLHIAPRIPQQAPRGRIRAMRHVIMGPQCGGHGEFDSL